MRVRLTTTSCCATSTPCPAPALGFQIQRDAFLVRIQQAEEHRIHVGPLAEPETRRLTGRRLDLDDLGAEPRERLRATRAGLVLREIEDANALERFPHRLVL